MTPTLHTAALIATACNLVGIGFMITAITTRGKRLKDLTRRMNFFGVATILFATAAILCVYDLWHYHGK